MLHEPLARSDLHTVAAVIAAGLTKAKSGIVLAIGTMVILQVSVACLCVIYFA